MKRFLLLTAATVGLLCAGTGAQASSIPPSWSYSYASTTNPNSLNYQPNGSLNFGGVSNNNVVGSSTVTLANLSYNTGTTTGTNTASGPINWSGTLSVVDNSSGTSASLQLSGVLNGVNSPPQFAPGTSSTSPGFSNLQPIGPVVANSSGTTGFTSTGTGSNQIWSWLDTKTNNLFTIPVADLLLSPPGAPFSPSLSSSTTAFNTIGVLTAGVEVSNNSSGTGSGGTGTGSGGTGSGNTASTPEPSTLLLSCFGFGFAGLASWRRRRSLATQLA